MTRFSKEKVERHIRRNHPGCPDFAVTYIAQRVSDRDWQKLSLGAAVGIMMQTVLRHEMTDYDQLLLIGVERQEARRRVQWKIHRMLEMWKKKPEPPKEMSIDASRT